MNQDELLNKFRQEFQKYKTESGFKATLEELENIFFLNDYILKEGYISTQLGRSICHRIASTFLSWNQYLHSLVMPSQHSLPNITESKIFDENEKKEITKIMDKIMELSSKNMLIGLSKDKIEEAKYIDYSKDLWQKDIHPKLLEIAKKINCRWNEECKE